MHSIRLDCGEREGEDCCTNTPHEDGYHKVKADSSSWTNYIAHTHFFTNHHKRKPAIIRNYCKYNMTTQQRETLCTYTHVITQK